MPNRFPPEFNWKQDWRESYRKLPSLLRYLHLNPEEIDLTEPEIQASLRDFPLRVTRFYASKISKGNPKDPLLLQVLPQKEELLQTPGFSKDAVGDQECTLPKGIIHKYQGRVLLLSSPACAMHCRYCFRRHTGKESLYRDVDALGAVSAIQEDTTIEEVILSGGDPLSSGNREILAIVRRLGEISHLKRLRIHTRIPTILPSRITEALLQIFRDSALTIWMVLHVNHPNELDEETKRVCNNLQKAGVHLLNQSVLLQGVNDQTATLTALSQKLLDHGVMPYYLHLLDRVQGTAHFEVQETKAKQIVEEMRKELPGYAVPRLAREIAGEPGKTILA